MTAVLKNNASTGYKYRSPKVCLLSTAMSDPILSCDINWSLFVPACNEFYSGCFIFLLNFVSASNFNSSFCFLEKTSVKSSKTNIDRDQKWNQNDIRRPLRSTAFSGKPCFPTIGVRCIVLQSSNGLGTWPRFHWPGSRSVPTLVCKRLQANRQQTNFSPQFWLPKAIPSKMKALCSFVKAAAHRHMRKGSNWGSHPFQRCDMLPHGFNTSTPCHIQN